MVDGDWALGAVVAHVAAWFHAYQNDAERWIFDDGLRTTAGFTLPGLGVLQLFQFAVDVLPDDLACELRQASQVFVTLGCNASLLIPPIEHLYLKLDTLRGKTKASRRIAQSLYLREG